MCVVVFAVGFGCVKLASKTPHVDRDVFNSVDILLATYYTTVDGHTEKDYPLCSLCLFVGIHVNCLNIAVKKFGVCAQSPPITV